MSHLGKHQKIAAAVAGLVLVYLVYRHFSGATAGTTAAGSAAGSDPSANDYANLAGQEQGDVAALQNQIAALGSQEQSDVSALQNQPMPDLVPINDQIQGILDQLAGMAGSATQPSTTGQAMGTHPTNRHKATRDRKAAQAKQHKAKSKRDQRNAGRTSSGHVHASPNRHVAPAVHAPHPSHPAAGHNPPAHRPARHPATVGARFAPNRPQAVFHPAPPPRRRGKR